jgi:hypothetical protein
MTHSSSSLSLHPSNKLILTFFPPTMVLSYVVKPSWKDLPRRKKKRKEKFEDKFHIEIGQIKG